MTKNVSQTVETSKESATDTTNLPSELLTLMVGPTFSILRLLVQRANFAGVEIHYLSLRMPFRHKRRGGFALLYLAFILIKG
jgi:hypothetical protein